MSRVTTKQQANWSSFAGALELILCKSYCEKYEIMKVGQKRIVHLI